MISLKNFYFRRIMVLVLSLSIILGSIHIYQKNVFATEDYGEGNTLIEEGIFVRDAWYNCYSSNVWGNSIDAGTAASFRAFNYDTYVFSTQSYQFDRDQEIKINVAKGVASIVLWSTDVYEDDEVESAPYNYLRRPYAAMLCYSGSENSSLRVPEAGEYYLGIKLAANTETVITSLYTPHVHRYTTVYAPSNGKPKGFKKSVCICGREIDLQYLLEVHANEGVEEVTGSGYYKQYQSVSLSAKAAPGFSISRWSGFINNNYFSMPGYAIDMYVDSTRNHSKITFDLNGGTMDTIDNEMTFSGSYDGKLTFSYPVKDYYTFTGWNGELKNGTILSKDTGFEYIFGPTNNTNEKLTANWEEATPEYEEGCGPENVSGIYADGSMVHLCIKPVEKSYQTITWEYSNDGINYIAKPELNNCTDAGNIKLDYIKASKMYYKITLKNINKTLIKTIAITVQPEMASIEYCPEEITTTEGVPTPITINTFYAKKYKWEISDNYDPSSNQGDFYELNKNDWGITSSENNNVLFIKNPKLLNHADNSSVYYLRCIVSGVHNSVVSDVIKFTVNSKNFDYFNVDTNKTIINLGDYIFSDDINVMLFYDNKDVSLMKALPNIYFDSEGKNKSLKLNNLGTKDIQIYLKNAEGKMIAANNKLSVEVKDISSPIINGITPYWEDGIKYNYEILNTSKRISLSVNAVDNDSIHYKWSTNENMSDCSVTNNCSYVISDNGTYFVQAYDNAGNESEKKSICINAWDKQMPSVSYSVTPEDYSRSKVIKIIAEDNNKLPANAYSYDAGRTYTNQTTITVSNNSVLNVYVKDQAGNISENKIEITKIDNTAPVIFDVIKNNEANEFGIINQTFAEIKASDNESGIKYIAYDKNRNGRIEESEWILNASEHMILPIEYDLVTNTQSRLFGVKDYAGNASYILKELDAYILPYNNYQEMIDNEIKITSVNIPTNKWVNQTTGVKLSFDYSKMSDNTRNIISEYVTWSTDIDHKTNSHSILVNKNGKYYVNFYLKSNNKESIGRLEFNVDCIDATEPEVKVSLEGNELHISAKDNQAGLSRISIQGGDYISETILDKYAEILEISEASNVKENEISVKLKSNGDYSLKVFDTVGNYKTTCFKVANINTNEKGENYYIPVKINDNLISNLDGKENYSNDFQTIKVDLPDEIKELLDDNPYSWNNGYSYSDIDYLKVTENGKYSLWLRFKDGSVVKYDDIIIENIDKTLPLLFVHNVNDCIYINTYDKDSGISEITILEPDGSLSCYTEIDAYLKADGEISLSHKINQTGKFLITVVDKAGNSNSYSLDIDEVQILSEELLTGNITVEYPNADETNKYYTKENAKIVARFNSTTLSALDFNAFSWDNGKNFTSDNYCFVSENGTYSLLLKTKEGSIIGPIKVIVDHIDKEMPILNVSEKNREISIKAYDLSSGIKSISVYDPGLILIDEQFNINPDGGASLKVSAKNDGLYTIYVRDALGNETIDAVTIETELKSIDILRDITIEHLDQLDVSKLALPEYVDINTTNPFINKASVKWDTTPFTSGIVYNINDISQQQFFILGQVMLDDNVIVENDSISSVQIKINVLKGSERGHNFIEKEDLNKLQEIISGNEIYAKNEYLTVKLLNETYEYTGSEIIPELTVEYTYDNGSKKKLSENVDYIIKLNNNINAGSAEVIIVGVGDFSGKVTKKFNILKKNINQTKVMDIPNIGYTGENLSEIIKNNLQIFDNNIRVSPNEFELEFDNTPIGIKGKDTVINLKIKAREDGNYLGIYNKEISIKIIGDMTNKTDLGVSSNVTLSLSKPDKEYYYTGKEIKPKINVFINGKKASAKDYIVNYNNNIHAGIGEIWINGKNNNYNSSNKITFVIKKQDINKAKVKNLKLIFGRNIEELNPMLKYGKNILSNNRDYGLDIDELKNIDLLGQKLRIVAIHYNALDSGDFYGTKSVKVYVYPRKLSNTENTKITVSNAYININGQILNPQVNVYYNNNMLINGSDYILEYSNDINKGKGTVKIIGVGNYSGSRSVQYLFAK